MCFTDYITFKEDCDSTTPTSGLFFNNLGISKEEVNDYVSEDYEDSIDLASEQLDFAIKEVKNEVLTHFASKIRASSILDGYRIGLPKDDLKVKDAEVGDMVGIEIEICQSNSFIDFYLSEISLQLAASKSVDVEVWDLIQNKLLDTISVTAVDEEIITVQANKTYQSDRRQLHLFIGYDSTDDSYEHVVSQKGCAGCNAKTLSRLNTFVKARGVKVSGDKIDANLTGLSHTGGLSLVYSINCNYEEWMCSVRNLLASAVLYKWGANIMEFALNKPRLNARTTINRDILKDRMERYGLAYENKLGNILKNMRLPSDRRCFNCNPKTKSVVSLPA